MYAHPERHAYFKISEGERHGRTGLPLVFVLIVLLAHATWPE